METAPGIPGSIPSLAIYPPQSISSHLPKQEWETCIESWLISIETRLRLKKEHFSALKFSHPASGIQFLLSYMRSYEQRSTPIQSGSKDSKLHHHCYFLLKRLFLETTVPYDCPLTIIFDLLGYGSLAFHAISDWKNTLKQVWKRNDSQIKLAIESCKSNIIKNFPEKENDPILLLHNLSAIVKCLPEVAVTAVAGADYLEAINATFSSYQPETRKAVVESMYHSLKSFMTSPLKHTSLLLDILFDLKSETDRTDRSSTGNASLLSSLLCTTPFLKHLKADTSIATTKRGQGLVDTLSNYKQHTLHLHPLPATSNKQRSKGKSRADPSEDMHIHKASQVSQIHDLFPDLAHGYVLKLLDHFSDDVETVIAALLEPGSLPSSLKDQGTGDEADFPSIDNPEDLAPRSTPPLLPQRRNKYDNDDFDQLRISSSKLHRGRKDINSDEPILAGNSQSKAAILSALAAFDADDDERDDTYDVADVGGAVDNTLDSDERRAQQEGAQNEEILFRAWQANPEVFARDSNTRLSKPRRQLQEDTGMGHEQLEGWAIMMTKDPKNLDRLQQKYSVDRMFRGNQQVIQSTKWQANNSPSDSQDESAPSDGRRIGQAGIRGPRVWNRGRGRGGGNTSGPAQDEATQLARKRKEQGRGRGGAHNRRDGRAKKIGRGMAGPAT